MSYAFTFPLLLAFLFPSLLAGSSIRLEVKDASNSTVRVSGRILDLKSGRSASFASKADGNVLIEKLESGRYRIEVSAKGFVAEAVEIDLAENTNEHRTILLAIASSNFQVAVKGASPLPGLDRTSEQVTVPLQLATSADIEKTGALNLSDFLDRRVNGVYVNELQGNPFQVDLNYRGYTASPLLGTPQGLSLFMDGVRLNQPFGDVVSWDLIPKGMIAEFTLEPGSNPLFGLNTLGGALAIETKDGHRFPGSSVQLGGGSFGRKTLDLEHGGSHKNYDWFVGSSLFFEDGWRESSPTNVRQLFGRGGWNTGKSVFNLSVVVANNSLTGNGIQEQRLLQRNYRSVYTKPDITNQKSPFVNLRGRRVVGSNWLLAGNVYYRSIGSRTLNGDINEESLDQSLYALSADDISALSAAGYSGFPLSGSTAANTPFPKWRCIAQVLQQDEPSEKCNALLNRSWANQHYYGVLGQLSWIGDIGRRRHQITLGGAYDRNRVSFQQSTQLGYLNPDRSVVGLNAFADGVTGGSNDDEPFDSRVDLLSRAETASIFVSDLVQLANRISLNFSGRFNRTHIDNADRIMPGGGTGSLNGLHTFQRFNMGAGLTYRIWNGLTSYANYNEGSRAPTSIELGCADPNAPCRLPNSMAGDPPLLQVVTRTVEAGLKGATEGRFHWNAGYFRSENRNDILFVASEQTGFGYFRNFGRTRRQGFEAAFSSQFWRLTFGTDYTRLSSTFQSSELVNGAGNSENLQAVQGKPGLESSIRIAAGSKIPLTPGHTAKAYSTIQVTKNLSLNFNMIAISRSFARGNENNLHKPDGRYYLGPGYAPGYLVGNLGSQLQLTKTLQLYLQISNLLNRKYSTAAQLGATGFTSEGNFVARPFPQQDGEFPLVYSTFYAPGAPRAAWGGLRFRF